MNLLIALAVLALVGLAALLWDVHADGYRFVPVDPNLRQRLLDRDEVQRTYDARLASDAADHADASAARRTQ